MPKTFRANTFALTCLLACGLLAGCQRAADKQPPPQLSEFERSMVTVRNGGFLHTYVFARKDGQTLQADDKAFLKAHPPDDVNSMWLLTDGERRVILGTNTDLTPENKDALGKRFAVEDYTGR